MKVSDAPPPAKGQPNDQPQAGGTVALSEAQFARIEELLLPGYQLAKAYLDQMSVPEPNLAEFIAADLKEAPTE